MYYFKYREDISRTKKIEPLISSSKNESKAIYPISEYFNNLNSSNIEELNYIYEYSQKVSKKQYLGSINKES